MTYVFPSVLIALNACASLVYAWHGEWRLAAYWAFACGLNVTVLR